MAEHRRCRGRSPPDIRVQVARTDRTVPDPDERLPGKQLGQRTKLDSATLTGILDRLEAMGLVERRPNPADRRAILVCLTKKGKKLAGEVHKTIEKANGELLTGFGIQEERGLKAMLRRIHYG